MGAAADNMSLDTIVTIISIARKRRLLSALGPARHLLRPLSAMHRRFSGVLPSWNLEHSIHIRSKRQPGDGETGGQHCQ